MGLAVREILKIGENRLTDAGCSNPKIDAELLYCHMMSLDRDKLFMHWGETISDHLCSCYFELLDVRASGKPLQYITGFQEFMGIRMAVDENVLIPRQETELLVERALSVIAESRKKTKRTLDLCTGSGAVAVSIAAQARDAEVTASDVSAEALAVAEKNAAAANVKVSFRRGDLFEPFAKRFGRTAKFDVITANPPYIKTDMIRSLQREVRDFEPMLALDGGEDGLFFYRKIVSQAPSYLAKNGVMLLEIGFDQAEAVGLLACEAGAYRDIEIVRDLAALDRIVILRKA